MARKTSTKRRLDTIRKNKKKLRDAINTLPRRAPPTLGLLGQAYNLVRTVPEPFIDASSLAFTPEGFLIGANEFERRLTNDDGSPSSRLTSMDDIEKLISAAGDEEFLNSDLVDAIVRDVQTGREVIRASGQFDLQNLLPRDVQKVKRTRAKTKTDKNMSKALTQANKRFRTKSGKLRKGATQGKIMKFAHKLLKKMK